MWYCIHLRFYTTVWLHARMTARQTLVNLQSQSQLSTLHSTICHNDGHGPRGIGISQFVGPWADDWLGSLGFRGRSLRSRRMRKQRAMRGWASLEDKILYVGGPGCKRTNRNRSKQQQNGGKGRMSEPRDGTREGTSVSAAPRRPHQDPVHDPARPAAAR